MPKKTSCEHSPLRRCLDCFKALKAADHKKRYADPEYRAKRLEQSKQWTASNPERHTANVTAWHKANPERRRFIERRMLFRGVTIAQLITFQQGKCALCVCMLGEDYHVDHDHETGFVRGLLCPRCNKKLQDDRRILARTPSYLENPPAKQLLEQAQEPVQLSFDFSLINPSPDRISNV